jgi:hypothetical protein
MLRLAKKVNLDEKAPIKAPTEIGAQTTGAQDISATSWCQKLPFKLKNKRPSRKDEESQTPSNNVKIELEPVPPVPNKDEPAQVKSSNMELINRLHGAIADCDDYLLRRSRALVRTVLREHFQEVLKMLNGDDEDDDDDNSRRVRITLPAANRRRRLRTFEDLSMASPEDRQKVFIRIYFDDVLREVKHWAATASATTFFDHLTTTGTTISEPVPPILGICCRRMLSCRLWTLQASLIPLRMTWQTRLISLRMKWCQFGVCLSSACCAG